MSAPVQLFDVPGPRGRMQQRILAAVLAAITLGLGFVAVHRLAEKGNFAPAKWTPFLQQVVWREYLIPGLQHTLTAAALAIVLAGALGLVLGLGRLSQIAPIRWVCSVVVEFFRAVPVLVMMIFSFWLYALYNVFPPSQLALAGTVTGLVYDGLVLANGGAQLNVAPPSTAGAASWAARPVAVNHRRPSGERRLMKSSCSRPCT